MREHITAYVDEDLGQVIEAIADHHDIGKSRVIEMLLYEGIRAREMRYRFEQLDAKLDVLIESLGGEPVATEAVKERFETVAERDLPADRAGADLDDGPFPFFQAAGPMPDSSDAEERLKAVLKERAAIEGAGDDGTEQNADD